MNYNQILKRLFCSTEETDPKRKNHQIIVTTALCASALAGLLTIVAIGQSSTALTVSLACFASTISVGGPLLVNFYYALMHQQKTALHLELLLACIYAVLQLTFATGLVALLFHAESWIAWLAIVLFVLSAIFVGRVGWRQFNLQNDEGKL